MGRILAIDYGRKRCGIAATDPLRLIASGLETVPTHQLPEWVKNYVAHEPVDAIVVGLPRDMHGNPSESMNYITPGVNRLRKLLPEMKIVMYDERFTSVLAHQAMIEGLGRERRRDKATVDRTAATIILTDYLNSRQRQDDGLN